jgi:hypothetical protein
MSAVATYLYCILRSPRAPGLGDVPRGLPRCGKPRVLEADPGLWLVLADAPVSLYGEAALERGLRDIDWVSRCAVAHEGVVEAFHRTPAVLPLRLFTLFSSDARALAYVRRDRRKLTRLLDRVEGRREWSVRMAVDPTFAPAPAAPPRSGTAFLARKHKLQSMQGERMEQGRRRADALFRTLGTLAAAHHRRTENETEPGSKLVLDAVYLVKMSDRVRFASATRKAATDLARRGLHLSVTGPWPPYHFAA